MRLDYAVLAIRNLRKRTIRSWLTLIGIFIGISAVVSLVALGEGLGNAVVSQFESLGSDKLIIEAASAGFAPPGFTAVNKLTQRDLEAIRDVNGVKLAAPRLINTAKVEFKDEQKFFFISSLPEDESRKLVIEALDLKVLQGRLLEKDDSFKVLVGRNFNIRNVFNKKVNVGDKLIINDKEFEVVGILDEVGGPAGNEILLLNENTLRDILHIKDEIDIIAVQVNNADEIESVAKSITKKLRKSRNVEEGKEDFLVETPLQVAQTFQSIFGAVQVVIIGIASISLIVGGIGIMNTMYTSVLERTQEIGIMKSVGARNSDIMYIFLIESGILGLTGGLIGVILGIGLAKLVEIISNRFFAEGLLATNFTIFLILGSLLVSTLLGTISGVLPARQAANLKPVDALRK